MWSGKINYSKKFPILFSDRAEAKAMMDRIMSDSVFLGDDDGNDGSNNGEQDEEDEDES